MTETNSGKVYAGGLPFSLNALRGILAARKAQEPKADEAREREAREAERLARYRDSVPRRYWNEGFETFRVDTDGQQELFDTAFRYAKETAAGGGGNLLLLGSPGTGKTHLACAVIRECGGLYRLASQIEDELLLARSFASRETPEEVLGHYGRVRLLVIDEAGREGGGRDMLYRVINARYNERRPTVIISNLDKESFAKFAGLAAMDRLLENLTTVEAKGKSFRMG